jgi:hypothetical protein
MRMQHLSRGLALAALLYPRLPLFSGRENPTDSGPGLADAVEREAPGTDRRQLCSTDLTCEAKRPSPTEGRHRCLSA